MNSSTIFNPYIITLITLVPLTFAIFFIQKRNKLRLKPKTERKNYRKFKKEEVDMGNLMDSINKSSQLHKELASKYHPDRFLDEDKKSLAEELMKDINGNRTDYKKLLELKEKAINNLAKKE